MNDKPKILKSDIKIQTYIHLLHDDIFNVHVYNTTPY